MNDSVVDTLQVFNYIFLVAGRRFPATLSTTLRQDRDKANDRPRTEGSEKSDSQKRSFYDKDMFSVAILVVIISTDKEPMEV